uniref:Uncharacterized protein n=1 Tax=Triticum urartu TaxID=4572 RepID=A0A8R7QE59_TRIUA
MVKLCRKSKTNYAAYSLSITGFVRVHSATGACARPTCAMRNVSPTSEFRSITSNFLALLCLTRHRRAEDNSPNAMAPPTTPTATFQACEPPLVGPPAAGIGGAIAPGGNGAGATSLEFTTIEKCPWRYVAHTLLASWSRNCGTPSKSNHTHRDRGAGRPAGAALTLLKCTRIGLPDATMFSSGNPTAERLAAS